MPPKNRVFKTALCSPLRQPLNPASLDDVQEMEKSKLGDSLQSVLNANPEEHGVVVSARDPQAVQEALQLVCIQKQIAFVNGDCERSFVAPRQLFLKFAKSTEQMLKDAPMEMARWVPREQ